MLSARERFRSFLKVEMNSTLSALIGEQKDWKWRPALSQHAQKYAELSLSSKQIVFKNIRARSEQIEMLKAHNHLFRPIF